MKTEQEIVRILADNDWYMEVREVLPYQRFAGPECGWEILITNDKGRHILDLGIYQGFDRLMAVNAAYGVLFV